MTILTSKRFDKQFAKLRPSVKLQFKTRVEIFKQDVFDSELRNHSLKGKYKGYRSIDITWDIRALYTEKARGEIIIFAFIGTHSQLYG